MNTVLSFGLPGEVVMALIIKSNSWQALYRFPSNLGYSKIWNKQDAKWEYRRRALVTLGMLETP